jgi:hypothetical protein
MSESFDPYHIWLGIPPKDQPPNHYRLLGIQELEEHTDVIDAAANRQTTYLHEMAAGPHRKESQQLLNEIAAARRCLLSPEQKLQYDAKLRAEHAAAQAAQTAAVPVAQAVAPPVAQPVAPAVPFIDTGEFPSSELPAFDFSPGGSPEVAVNNDVGIFNPGAGSSTQTAPQSQPAMAGATNQPGEAVAATGKKPIPRQWIITGCSVVVVAIIAFVLTTGSDSDDKKRSTGTSTRLDGSGEAVSSKVSAGSGNSSPKKSKDGSAKADDDDGRSLFDQADTSDSPLLLPSNFGGNEKKTKKK